MYYEFDESTSSDGASALVYPPRSSATLATLVTVTAIAFALGGMYWASYVTAMVASVGALVVLRIDGSRQSNPNYVRGVPIGVWMRALRWVDLIVAVAAMVALAVEAAR